MGPSAESATEGTRFGIAKQQGNIGKAVIGSRHIVLSQGPPNALDQMAEIQAMLSQATLQGAYTHPHAAGHLFQAHTAAFEAAGDMQPQLAE